MNDLGGSGVMAAQLAPGGMINSLRYQEVVDSNSTYPTSLKRRLRPMWSLDRNEWKRVPGARGTWEILREYIPERRYHCSIDEAIFIGLDYRIYIRNSSGTKPMPV